jgi:hypothetical protein
MPANLPVPATMPPPAPIPITGPPGPFPSFPLRRVLERRWLHYAFLSRDGELGLVANVAWLGGGLDGAASRRSTSILLLYRRGRGWEYSEFNADTSTPLWSAFRRPHHCGVPGPFDVCSTAGSPGVALELQRTSRPCTSQTAPFARRQHLRWQSEPGVIARGRWSFAGEQLQDVEAIGYHERVRGYWGWPELGGWVFGFANDPCRGESAAPPAAIVFTLIQPPRPARAANGSVMVWRDGRFVRHFARRQISVAVRGELDKSRVTQAPGLAQMFGVPPMEPIPRRLIISAAAGQDRVTLDFLCESAARVVIPAETAIRPFSVHEVIGTVTVEGTIAGRPMAFETTGIVEFAGGAGGD